MSLSTLAVDLLHLGYVVLGESILLIGAGFVAASFFTAALAMTIFVLKNE
jgi:hypothetical protein